MNNSFKIVLVEPQIPQNTGNIVRLCACTGSELYLVGKLGFSISDKYLKRAGLDYWEDMNINKYNHLEDLMAEFPDSNFYFLTTKTKNSYSNHKFKEGDFLVFGSETKGLPEKIIFGNADKALTIPMKENQRSLNLSNSVAIVLYEAIRQTNLNSSW